MRCPRCGTSFEGASCPACGAPAIPSPSTAPQASPPGWPCAQCGTPFVGNFCPRCGLPAYLAHPPPSPHGSGRPLLSVLWTVSIVAFLVLAALSLAGLLVAPSLVVPGIQGMGGGETENAAVDINGDGWTFTRVAANGTWTTTAGDGYLAIEADPTPAGDEVLGFWWQAFEVSGSQPYAARVQLAVQVALGDTATRGTLSVYIEGSPVVPSGPAVGTMDFVTSSAWTLTPRFIDDEGLTAPGTYYLIVAFATSASSAGSSTVVGLDDIRLVWATNAGVVFYVALPLPAAVYASRDPALFLGYFAFLVLVVVLAVAYHAIRERRPFAAAFLAPLHAVGARLRARSAWLAVAQVFLATWFFQYALILALEAAGALPPSPIQIDATNVWVWLYEFANASVYEEFAFRLLLIGLPMAIGSFILRIVEVNRSGGTWRGSTTPGRYIAGAGRYLLGGTVRRTASKEVLLASAVLVFVSATIFGLAHLPGWGGWKVLPSLVAGLGLGYLFLRHGVTAAILAHFAFDYSFSLVYIGFGGGAFELLMALYGLGLAAAGSGFFAWYVLYAWGLLRDLRTRLFGPRARAVPAAPAPGVPPRASFGPTPVPVPAPDLGAATTWANPAAAGPPSRAGPTVPRGYAPTYRPPLYGYPPVRFQCPSCGWVEARYETGRFTCLRCGKVF